MATIVPLPDSAGNGDVILFFSPEAGVRAHFAAQCVVARTLQELGHRVLFINEGRLVYDGTVKGFASGGHDLDTRFHELTTEGA